MFDKRRTMKILFLHGWHSVVGGVKPTFLRDAGHEVINPALDDDDFAAALQVAQLAFDTHCPDVIVGSSRGGAIAMNLDSRNTPLVLLCPAWKNWGTVTHVKPATVILHSPEDDVIPFAHSEELIAKSGLPFEALIQIGRDHRLADPEPLSVMLWACELLNSGQQIPPIDEGPQPELTDSTDVYKPSSDTEASYLCDACGEEIIIPLDLTAGTSQTYVEDCPVCCRANVIKVQLDPNGALQAWAEPEQDHD